MAALEAGHFYLLRYNVPGAVIWHERFAGAVTADGQEAGIVTPDVDEYLESVVVDGDVAELRLTGAQGANAFGIPAGQIYRFQNWPVDAVVAQWIRDAHAAAGVPLPASVTIQFAATNTVGRAAGPLVIPLGGPVGGGGGGAAGVAPMPVVPAAPPLAAPVGAVPGALPLAAPVGGALAVAAAPPVVGAVIVGPLGLWILDEPMTGRQIGDPIGMPAGTLDTNGRAFALLDGRTITVRFLAAGTNVDTYVLSRKAELCLDNRTIACGPTGTARNFVDCVAEMVEDPTQVFSILGPRTMSDQLAKAANRGAGGFVADFDFWVAQSGIKPHDRSVYEDQVLAKAIQLAITRDGLNVLNLESFELLVRRRQLLKDVHAENPDKPSWEGWEHYLGIAERRGGASIAPALRAHVAAEVGKEAAIAKERRKVREARGGGKGGGKVHD